MTYAVWNMVNRDGGVRTSSKNYEILKKQRSLLMSATLRGENNPMYGKKHSEEHKKMLSEKLKGRKKPDSQREKLRVRNSGAGNPQYGKPKTHRQVEAARELLKNNNPMFDSAVVDKIRKAKAGTINCYDLINSSYVRVTREQFLLERNTRYVGTTSKLIPKG